MKFLIKLVRFYILLVIARLIKIAINMRGKSSGTSFIGMIMLKISPNFLRYTANYIKNEKIAVTGTNGKTTTAGILSHILENNNNTVIHNEKGANMLTGIANTMALSIYPFKRFDYAVLESDEAYLSKLYDYIETDFLIVTNLFRDQLDRYGEVYTTLSKILEGITLVPTSKLILNGDESLLGKLDVKNPLVFYGFKTPINENKTIDVNADSKFCKFCKTPYSYNFVTYNHLGDYYCTGCGYKRPTLKYGVDEIVELTAESSTVKFGDTKIFLGQSGVYNIYNALCAYSITKELNIDDSFIKKSLESQSSSFGRQEIINIDDKEAKIILVKNPAGYNQALDTLCLNKEPFSCAFLLNDNYADGRDVSWIWDVNFENLNNVKLDEVYVSGLRTFDMAVRLKTAGISPSKFVIEEEYENLTNQIKNGKNKKIYILATYTAMINYRKYLHSKGYIKNLW